MPQKVFIFAAETNSSDSFLCMYKCVKAGLLDAMLTYCPPQAATAAVQSLPSLNDPLFAAVPVRHGSYAPAAALSVVLYRSIDDLGVEWDHLSLRSGNLFLQRHFLAAVEQAPPEGLRQRYLVFFDRHQPVGLALLQVKHFVASESLRDQEREKETCFFAGLAQWFKKRVSNWAEADIMICGNMLLTGAHGYWFDPSVPQSVQARSLYDGLQAAVGQINAQDGIDIAMILVKDIPAGDEPVTGRFLEQKQFTAFEIQPNMVLDLAPFSDFEGYLDAMTTKYRTRAKRAFKKLNGIEKRTLSLNEVAQYGPRLYQLYREVANNAGFNMVDLHPDYFRSLAEKMPESYQIDAYFLNGQLVSYYTTIKNGPELEAHFLGYDKAYNHDYQLYLNMLYDMVQRAFDTGCTEVIFARTALEIKSSVGAAPVGCHCYLRHQNNIVNRFTGNILDYLKPVEEWQQRHPFKHAQPEGVNIEIA